MGMNRSERQQTEAEAEQVQRAAIRRMAVFAGIFMVWQACYFLVFSDPGEHVRAVDVVRTVGLLAWVIALLGLFVSGGAWRGRRRLRSFLNDERAMALRAESYRAGFWMMVVICMLGYIATLWFTIRAVDVAHLVLSGGVLALLLTRVLAERR